METQHVPRERDVILDAWRGISILLVILHHAVYFRFGEVFRGFLEVSLPASASFLYRSLWMLDYALVEFSERAGPLGVKIFFVISGYIITKLLIEEELRAKTIDVWGFYFRRVVRILPALLLYVCSVFLFSLFGWVAFDAPSLFAALGFVCNTELVLCSQPLIHTWTLSIEEQFYILWPLVFILVSAHWRSVFLAASFLVLIILSALEIFIAYDWINNPQAYACIVIGVLYASSAGWKRFVDRWGIVMTILCAACIVALAQIPGFGEIARKLYWSVTPFALLAMVMGSYAVKDWIPAILIRALAFLGLFSYSLYLWQEIFLMEKQHYLVGSPLEWTFLLIPVTLASYYFLEQPLIRWGKRVYRASRP
ncbi:MAG: acyltransferase [Minisyncoccia bacterium]